MAQDAWIDQLCEGPVLQQHAEVKTHVCGDENGEKLPRVRVRTGTDSSK